MSKVDDSDNKLVIGDVDYEEWESRLSSCVAVRVEVLEGYGAPLYAAVDITDSEQFILCGTFSMKDTMTFIRNNDLKVALTEEVSVDAFGGAHSHFAYVSRGCAWRRHTHH